MSIKGSHSRKESRRKTAQRLEDLRANRTDEEQLRRLDGFFGEGKGAEKERAKLEKRINKAKES